MTTLLTVADIRTRIATAWSDVEIQDLIDLEEGELIRRYGAHSDGSTTSITEQARVYGGSNAFLARPIASVTSVSEALVIGGTATTLASSAYRAYPAQGRLLRLPSGSTWGEQVSVIYIPADDRDRRRRIIVDLCRLAIDRTAMKAESVAGEYSYTAPEWESERQRLYRQLAYPTI